MKKKNVNDRGKHPRVNHTASYRCSIEQPHLLLYIVKLSAIRDIMSHLWLAVTTGLKPTVLAICNEPGLLLRPATISRVFMAALWDDFGPAID